MANGGSTTYANYIKFLQTLQKNGSKVEPLKAGSRNQIVLKHDANQYPDFHIRNIKANNMLWTGKGETARELFTVEQLVDENGRYSENELSTAFLVTYGKFKYFEGDDNTGLTDYDRPEWMDIETPMSKVVGEVDVMSLCHHGNRDGTNETFLRTLDPKVVVAQSWSPDHPGAEVGHRLISPKIGTKKRDIYMTYYFDDTGIGIGPWFARNLKSREGHIVVRVYPNDTFQVFVIDSRNIHGKVVSKSELYHCSDK